MKHVYFLFIRLYGRYSWWRGFATLPNWIASLFGGK